MPKSHFENWWTKASLVIVCVTMICSGSYNNPVLSPGKLYSTSQFVTLALKEYQSSAFWIKCAQPIDLDLLTTEFLPCS